MIAILRSAASMAAFILSLALITVVGVPLLLLSGFRLRDHLIRHLGGFVGAAVLATAGVKLVIRDLRNRSDEPTVYISNHSSTLDMFVILALRLKRTRFVAKHELQYNPFFFIIGRMTGQVFLQRQDREKALVALDKALSDIRREGLSLYMAPEGTRKHESVVGPFKKGAFHMALKTGYPITPILIEGASALAHGGSLVTRPGTLTVTLQEEVDSTAYTPEQVDRFVEDVRNRYCAWLGGC